MAIVQHDIHIKHSTQEIIQILSMSLTDKTPLSELFDKAKLNNFNDQDSPLLPGLYNYFLIVSNFNGKLVNLFN